MSKLPLVLIPGLLCTAKLWAPQVTALSDVAECQIGDHTRHNTISGIARSILGNAPDRFALAGLSMGGYISFEIMRQAPERVEKLALLDTSALSDTDEKRHGRLALIDQANSAFESFLHSFWLHQMLAPEKRGDDDLNEEILSMARETGVETYVRQQQAIVSRPDSRATCEQINCPVMIVVGALDEATPVARHEEIHAITPNSELAVIKGCGHLSTIEAPMEVNALLREWLTC
ncbi:MAG: alpha/beta fold hydrolase [Hyphomicrobiales bacterium]